MAERRKHYDKRQIITLDNVPETAYTDKIILCIPEFGWIVARSFLATQAQWLSTYCVNVDCAGYTVPEGELWDKIQASIDETLLGGDMSCNITEAIENLTDVIAGYQDDYDKLIAALELLASGQGKSLCCGGSAGATGTETQPEDFVDDGTNYPDGFDTREQYDSYKCAIATHIVRVILADLTWLQNLPASEYIASVIVVTLLTPILGDEIIAIVGGLLFMVAEGIMDEVWETLITEIEEQQDEIKCLIYNALDASEAYNALQTWIGDHLEGAAAWLAQFWMGQDVVNWAFRNVNQLIDQYGGDCSDCLVDEGDYDFNLSDWGWLVDEETSYPDGEYRTGQDPPAPENYFWSGGTSGSYTANLAIFYPHQRTVQDIRVWARCTTEVLGHLRIYTSDDGEAWTPIASDVSVTADWVTPYNFYNLEIVDKWIMIQAEKYWAGPNVAIARITFDPEE